MAIRAAIPFGPMSWQATAVSLALKLPVLPAELRRKGFENAIGNASNSPQRFDPLFWLINNDETTSVGMRSATDATYR
jgi:hypothetical protein